MFGNNVKIALRNLKKNKLYATINIVGLALGLALYVFASLLADYERSHDLFFANADRIYTIGTTVLPESNLGIREIDSAHTALAPFIEAELVDVQFVARSLKREYLVSVDEESFYERVRFVDAEFTDIFDLTFSSGDSNALQDPSSVIISEAFSEKYFGGADPIGKVVTLDNKHDFYIAAVIENVPLNSHFNSSIMDRAPLDIFISFQALSRISDYDPAGEWDNLSVNDLTYVQLPPHLDSDWLQAQADALFDRHVPKELRDYFAGFKVRPLKKANLVIWEMIGLPVITIIKLLGLLVLIVACVNYTNLATAQALGRSREVGMRKTMGASQRQLLTQFLVESVTITAIAMLVALAGLEVVIQLFNNAANKVLALDYISILPWLLLTTLVVGISAGAYPAWLITRASPIDALRDVARKTKKGARFRAVMIGVQFAISVFMLSVVAIMYVQNQKMEEASYVFPRSEIYTLERLNAEGISERLDTLQIELKNIPGVENVAYSVWTPFAQSNSSQSVSTVQGDSSNKVSLHVLRISPEFFDTYDIPILAGSALTRDMANDVYREDSESLNVVVNELALEQLGLGPAHEAINKRFYDLDEDDNLRELVIKGVVPTQNIVGLHNDIHPFMFYYDPAALWVASIRIRGNMLSTVAAIEEVWKDVIPEYPMQGRFLDETFEDVFKIFRAMNMALAGFAGLALTLALIGLFGLAAFMAAQRTKEIGVRKVLGAGSTQIARLLVWQFTKPVFWALLVALPLAYFASAAYLTFFAERIASTQSAVIMLGAGFIGLLFAWGTVAGHAIRIAQKNPIQALRYE
jgi:putative ABC transport system permease protein